MKKQLKFLSIALLSCLLIFSCQQDDNVAPIGQEQLEPFEQKAALEKAASVLMEVSEDRNVQLQILGYATKENDSEAYASFEDLLPSDEQGRLNSPFASKFRSVYEEKYPDTNYTARTNGISNASDLEEFLKDNDFALYAPYYAEDFAHSDQPITISWWNGIDQSGETPAMVSSTNSRVNLLNVNDAYAENNPTWVIMPGDELIDEDDDGGSGGGGSGSGGSGSGGSGSGNSGNRDINCDNLEKTDVIELRMPQYRLNGNTRGWPQKNYLYLWVAVGSIESGDDGLPKAATNVNQLWNEKSVSRKNARKKNWLNSDIAYWLSNWKHEHEDLYYIFGYKKQTSDLKQTASTSVKIDKDGNATSEIKASTEEVNKSHVKKIIAAGLNKCSYLADHTQDKGQGTREGFRVYTFSEISFYLEPDLK